MGVESKNVDRKILAIFIAIIAVNSCFGGIIRIFIL
jgi:hypothetical protein